LSFFLNSRPYSFILDVPWIKRTIPDTSQNSIETKRLSTYVSCSTIRTVLVGRYGAYKTFDFWER
jgi:hypothetical protein